MSEMGMIRFILRSALLSTLLVAGIFTATSQTTPTPFNLAGGNYSFTTWAATEPAGTYPPSMVFHVFNQRIEPFEGTLTDAPKGDWGLAYNLTGSARLNGEGANGVSFLQTGTAQSGNCGFQGQAVLALNTLGRANVNVSWVGQVTASGTRPYNLRLQYRIGTSGAWVNAIGADGNYVQLASATDGFSAKTLNWMMPMALENQQVVQLRWIYFQDGNGSGARPRIRLDDVMVTSDSPVGTATGLKVFAITPQSPSVGTAFTVLVRSVDAGGAVKNVATSTTVNLARTAGTGVLSGVVNATIPAGSNSATFTVNYNTAEAGVTLTASRTAGDVLTSYTTAPFTVGAKAAYAILTGAWHQEWTGQTINPITVTVYKTDNTVDLNYTGTITASGSGLSGTTAVAAFRGVAVFSNLTLSFAGSQNLTFTVPGLPTQSTPTITVVNSPSLTTNVVPQYVNGATINGCDFSASVVPAYARVTFTGLQPNTTYRYNVGGSNVAGIPTSTGGGYNLHFDAATNTYSYSSSKSLTSAYSTFNSGNSTSKTLWINLLVTNASNFADGQTLYWQVALGDYVGNLISYYQLSQTSVLQSYGSSTNQITLIGDKNSQLTTKNYVLLYDNTTGSGRPVATSIVQSYGTTVSSFAQYQYSNFIENQIGAWMTVVPNALATGIRRIEERDANGNLVYSTTSTTGDWQGVSTYPMNSTAYPSGPGGATSPIYLVTPKITIAEPTSLDTLCASNPTTIKFRADGMDTVKIEFSIDNGMTYSLIDGNVLVGNGSQNDDDDDDYDDDYYQGDMINNEGETEYEWVVPSVGFQGKCFIRITGVDRPNEVVISKMFAIVEPLSVIGEVPSDNLCLGQTDTLIALVGGTAESFQWYKDGVAIPHGTGPILLLENVQYHASGVYWCEVGGYGDCGDVVTNKASIRVARQTQLTTQTFAVAGILGETVVMQVWPEVPDDVIGYQWYRGTTPIAESNHFFGTKSNRLEIRNFAQADYRNDYYCVITGVCGEISSRVVRVFPTGVYTEFVQSEYNGCVGSNLDVQASVYSNPPGEDISVRWYKDGVMLADGGNYAGTQTDKLTIVNVNPSLAGSYTVRAMLTLDNSVWSEATTTVVIATPPSISAQPAAASVCEGAAADLSVTANASGTISYQWTLNGTDIAGATNAMYSITAMSATTAGDYAVKVSTACGNVVSDVATVDMKAATSITTQPEETMSVAVGATLTITLVADGAGTLQYQWYHDGTAITGEIAPTFTKASYADADAGKYWCTVTGDCGMVTSDTTDVTTSPTSGVDDIVVGGAVVGRLAPNPTSAAATLSVSLSTPQNVTVTVVDAAGNTVLTVTNAQLPVGENRLPIITSSLPSGVYSVQTIIGGERSVQQLVVLK